MREMEERSATRAGLMRGVRSPNPSCPFSFPPHAYTVPDPFHYHTTRHDTTHDTHTTRTHTHTSQSTPAITTIIISRSRRRRRQVLQTLVCQQGGPPC